VKLPTCRCTLTRREPWPLKALPHFQTTTEERDVFEDHKAKKAAQEHESALADWQAERDAQAELLDTAKNGTGSGADSIMLKAGEAVFAKVTNTSLVEERKGPGHYQGHSQGVSIPIAKVGGRSIRYRVGVNKGHYVSGAPSPTAIDNGTTYITNQRVIFQGGKQTRECAFAKLIGFEHDDNIGTTTFSVSNRQKPTTIHYGPGIAGWFDFRLELGLAHFKGTVDQLVAELQADLDEIDKHRPPEPAEMAPIPSAAVTPVAPAAVPVPSATPQVPVATVNAGWYADPWKLANLRWWDGTQWTGNVHGAQLDR
jgi:hypothetical protein